MDMRRMKKAELFDLAQRLVDDNRELRDAQHSLYKRIEQQKLISKLSLIANAILILVTLGAGLLLRSNLCG